MGLGGTGGATAAIAASAPAQKDDYIAGLGNFPHHVRLGRSAHHRADFQALGDIAFVIELHHLAGGKADLVAVGGIAVSGAGGNLALGKLGGQRFAYGHGGIARTGHSHGLVDIGAPGKRIADGAAQTGGCAAEGLDFRGMVMGFIFKLHEPGFFFPVNLNGDLDGTGVDFLRFIQVRNHAPRF